MNTTHLRRPLAAVTTAVACLVLLAGPAAAATPVASIDSGTVDLARTGFSDSLDLSPEPTPPTCPANTITLDDGTGTTLISTALSWLGNETVMSNPLLVKLTRAATGNSAGTVDTTAQTITNMRVTVAISIYSPQSADCSTTGATLLCSLAVILNLSGTYTGTLGVGDTVSLAGSSVGNVVAFPTCTGLLTQFIGSAATVPTTDPLDLTVTTVGTLLDASIDDGTVSFAKTGFSESLDLSPEPPPPTCPANTITLDDGTGTTLISTALSWAGNETFAGNPYLVKITRLTTANSAGTLNTTTQTITNMRLALGIALYTPQAADCSTTGATLMCSLAVLLNLSGTYTGTLGIGDTVTLTGSSVGTVVANPTCTFGPSVVIGSTATIPATDPLVLTITA